MIWQGTSSIQGVFSSSVRQSPPRVTVLNNPARAHRPSSNQSTLSSSAPQPMPHITILTNPERVRSPLSSRNSWSTQNVSAEILSISSGHGSAFSLPSRPSPLRCNH
ncbi:hypothetical protein BC827DRAFT_929868 [Russula dissimulans]|nr:hypothetical protein BC827DRAFT_929868 [Russula dissimulans]